MIDCKRYVSKIQIQKVILYYVSQRQKVLFSIQIYNIQI